MKFKVGDYVILNDPEYFPKDVGKVGVICNINSAGQYEVQVIGKKYSTDNYGSLYIEHELSYARPEIFKKIIKELYEAL